MADFTRWLRRQRQLNAGGTLAINESGNPIESSVVTLQSTVTLTDAQIKALPQNLGGGIVLVAAPGAGKMIVPLTVLLRLNNDAGAYTNVNDPVPVFVAFANAGRWGPKVPDYFLEDAGPCQISQIGPDTFWNGTAIETGAIEAGNVADGVNDPLLLLAGNSGSDFTGGNAANSMIVTSLYAIVDVAG